MGGAVRAGALPIACGPLRLLNRLGALGDALVPAERQLRPTVSCASYEPTYVKQSVLGELAAVSPVVAAIDSEKVTGATEQ